ncbi:SDR family oxidoreductase [Persicimonas caeni]|nr:SDR family oxidoreductase [Persicimonas caeni]
MVERIVIVGTGYVGLELARQAIERGFAVTGTSRSPETLARLEGMGATGLRFDVLDDPVEKLAEVLDEHAAVVYSVPTVYRDYEEAESGMPRHVEPVDRVLQTCAGAGVERFVYLSSTSVYGDQDGAWVDEGTPRAPTSPYGKMRRDIENQVLDYDRDMAVNIARLVGIYGPGRTILEYIKSGRYKLVDGGKKPTNRVHVYDIAQSILAMIERGPQGGRVYNVSDGDPRTVAELVDFLVDRLGVERPEEVSFEQYAKTRGPNVAARWKNTYRCSNNRLVDELGVSLRYPNVLEGYRAIFGLGEEGD